MQNRLLIICSGLLGEVHELNLYMWELRLWGIDQDNKSSQNNVAFKETDELYCPTLGKHFQTSRTRQA